LATDKGFIVCDFCNKGRLISSLKEVKFRQWSKKGYVHFSVMLTVRVCASCGARSFEPGADQIMDEAFQREYEKLP
jgi:Cys-tRNA synthase (O-phospho-L-seryl-tRNA:Cys-tRNA synthase)